MTQVEPAGAGEEIRAHKGTDKRLKPGGLVMKACVKVKKLIVGNTNESSTP